ncbi:hypothetical protein [Kordia sp.]|uniref:hypothetical protein n=1 Tax=Kordia sp. TaxID=1965332 RepID=UPI003B5BF355
MNKNIYSFLILLFFGYVGLFAQTKKKYQKTFSVDKNTRLNFETRNIDVTFKIWDKDEVKVDFQVNFKNYTELEEKHIANGIIVYAAMQSTMGDSNYLEIRNSSSTSIGKLSYQIRSGEIHIKDMFAEKKEANTYKTVREINSQISKSSKGFEDLNGYVVFENDSVALKDIRKSNHKGIQRIQSTYDIYIPAYMMMDLNVTSANVSFEGKFTNHIVGSFHESNLIASELNNEQNSIALMNGTAKIKKIVGGNYMFRNATEGIIGQLENVKVQTEFSKFKFGEMSKDVHIHDFKSDFLIYNIGTNFNMINMLCEYSDIKMYVNKDQKYYLEAIGNNAVLNDDNTKIIMQPNKTGEKFKMFTRGKDDEETRKNTFKLDLVHGFVTLLYKK